MVGLKIKNLSHAYDDNAALSGVNLSVEQGEIICLLGASGCGKTTLLKLIAGLLPVQEGEIFLDGHLLADRNANPPPEKRPIGLVFQEGALFPHMSVGSNVGFGVSNRENSNIKVEDLLTHIGLDGFQDRYPHTLSGGQQQRVALARAIAPAPKMLLLDEPFAAVDIILRRELREQTRLLLKERKVTAIIVTHDPDEAMEMADRIAVIEGGRIVQFGTPQELYTNPASIEVGKLLADGQTVQASIEENKIQTSFGVWPIKCIKNDLALGEGTLLCNSKSFEIGKGDECVVLDKRLRGGVIRILLKGNGEETLWVDLEGIEEIHVSEKVIISPKVSSLSLFCN